MDDQTRDGLKSALEIVTKQDLEGVLVGEEEYSRSWLRHGSVGAFFTMIRCMHRFDVLCSRPASNNIEYDVFQHCLDSIGDSGVLNSVRDARRYLLLLEAELIRLGHTLPLQRHNQKKD